MLMRRCLEQRGAGEECAGGGASERAVGSPLVPQLYGKFSDASITPQQVRSPPALRLLLLQQAGAARSPRRVLGEEPHFLALITPTCQNESGSPTGLTPQCAAALGGRDEGHSGKGRLSAGTVESTARSELPSFQPSPVSSAPGSGWSRPPGLRRGSRICARPPSLSQRLLARVPRPLHQ